MEIPDVEYWTESSNGISTLEQGSQACMEHRQLMLVLPSIHRRRCRQIPATVHPTALGTHRRDNGRASSQSFSHPLDIGLLTDEADAKKFSRKRIAQKVLAEEITELVHGRMSSRTDLTLFALPRIVYPIFDIHLLRSRKIGQRGQN